MPAWLPYAVAPLIDDVVLYGFTMFDRAADAMRSGAARAAPTHRWSNVGAWPDRCRRTDEFEQALAAVDDDELETHGVVVNEAFRKRWSPTASASQWATTASRTTGPSAPYATTAVIGFGGSDPSSCAAAKTFARRAEMPDAVLTALARAYRYDAAIAREFPLFASSRNYDVACGRDADDRIHIGARIVALASAWRRSLRCTPERDVGCARRLDA